MKALALLVWILPLAALAADPPYRPESLETTSGSGAFALLDANRATGWSPTGDPEDEGIFFRFAPPLAADAVRVVSCPASPSVTLQAFVNGRRVGPAHAVDPGASANMTFPSRFKADAREMLRIEELFLRIDDAGGAPCIGEVVFERAGTALDVAPPRKIYATAVASSTLESHVPAAAFDGKPQTAWMESAKGIGEGEWIELRLSSSITVTAIELQNGRHGSKEAYVRHPRAKKLSVSAAGGKPFTLALKDKVEPQDLAFPDAVTASNLRFSVASVFPGTKKKDLALSDIMLIGEEGAIALSFEEPAIERRMTLPIADRQRVSFCAKGDGTRRRLKLRATGTFASWDEETSLLGSWKPADGAAPWTAIEIAGESRTTDGDAAKSKHVSARVEVARVSELGFEGFKTATAKLPNAACVATEGAEAAYRLLVEGDGIIVKGAGLDDVLWRTRR